MIYEKYAGHDTFVTIEGSADNPITHIAPKAFLSCKSIQRLTLPATTEHIGDWAFAHMQGLTDLTLPAKPITFGKQVFLDCENLKRIHPTPDTSGNKGLALFLGATVTILQDISLLCPEKAGFPETHRQWLTDFDAAVAAFVASPDEQGFEPIFYGWFNDEDADSTQLPKYLHKKRSQKLELAFLRLRYDLHLQEPLKALLQGYLTDHLPESLTSHLTTIQPNSATKPFCDSLTAPFSVTTSPGANLRQSGASVSHGPGPHTITWELLPEYCREDVSYIRILEEAGALTATNIPAFLTHLQNACPEVIAYLLRLQDSLREKNSFFDNFSL